MATIEHTELMDGVYRRQRYIYDFTRKYYLIGRDQLIAGVNLDPDQSLVEVGCGTARNLIKIARRYPGAALYGLDASSEMLKTARVSVSRAGLSDRIHLVQGYAEDLSAGMFGRQGAFDHVVFSYSLSMFPDWKQSLNEASQQTAEGGHIHVVDFGDLLGMGRAASSLLKTWLHHFHVTPCVEILQKLESLVEDCREQNSRLHVFPARYAFIWRGKAKSVRLLSL